MGFRDAFEQAHADLNRAWFHALDGLTSLAALEPDSYVLVTMNTDDGQIAWIQRKTDPVQRRYPYVRLRLDPNVIGCSIDIVEAPPEERCG